MEDFAIRVKGVPHHLKYDEEEEVLRILLIAHYETICREQFIKNYRRDQLFNFAKILSYHQAEELVDQMFAEANDDNVLKSKPWEVADVCYGSEKMKDVDFF